MEIAKASGFVISADDLKKAKSEVSDAELEEAAGGTNPIATDLFCRFPRS